MTFSHGSKDRLTAHDLGRFPGVTLFDRIGRALCGARCLPRKELYEAWEVGRRTRRQFRGGRVVDVAGGHGLLAHIMLLLDGTSPEAVVIDPSLPPSSTRVHEALSSVWPALASKVRYLQADLASIALDSNDIVVSSHACGALTDRVLDAAIGVHARVAVLPCCHDVETCAAGSLTGWLDPSLAIDVARATRLEQVGYRVWTQTIPATITPKNRLLLGRPLAPTS